MSGSAPRQSGIDSMEAPPAGALAPRAAETPAPAAAAAPRKVRRVNPRFPLFAMLDSPPIRLPIPLLPLRLPVDRDRSR